MAISLFFVASLPPSRSVVSKAPAQLVGRSRNGRIHYPVVLPRGPIGNHRGTRNTENASNHTTKHGQATRRNSGRSNWPTKLKRSRSFLFLHLKMLHTHSRPFGDASSISADADDPLAMISPATAPFNRAMSDSIGEIRRHFDNEIGRICKQKKIIK